MEAKEVMERTVRVEAERNVARHGAAMAWLEIEAMRGAREQVEAELSCIRHASAVAEDA